MELKGCSILIFIFILITACAGTSNQVIDIPNTPSFDIAKKQGNIYVVFDIEESELFSIKSLKLSDVEILGSNNPTKIIEIIEANKKTLLGFSEIFDEKYTALKLNIQHLAIDSDTQELAPLMPVSQLNIPILFNVQSNENIILTLRLMLDKSLHRAGPSDLIFLPVFDLTVQKAGTVFVKNDGSLDASNVKQISHELVSTNMHGQVVPGKITYPLLTVKDGKAVETKIVQELPSMPKLPIEQTAKPISILLAKDEFEATIYNEMLSPSRIELPKKELKLTIKSRDEDYLLEIEDLTVPFNVGANGAYTNQVSLKESGIYPVKCKKPCSGKILGYIVVR